ncbi:MAG: DEAD/DEAH box helicase [Clostridiales bacterium]
MLINGNYVMENKKGAFIFWGESEKYKHKRGTPKNIAPLYPNLADLKVLEYTLGKKGSIVEKIVVIPDDSIRNDENKRLSKYRIKGLIYEAYDVIDILRKFDDKITDNKENFRSNFKLSGQIIYWIKTLNFIQELLIKKKYYPYLENDKKDSIKTIWRLYTGEIEDKKKFNILMENLPFLCRLYFNTKDKNFIPIEKKEIMDQFIDYIINYYVKSLNLEESISPKTIFGKWIKTLFSKHEFFDYKSEHEILLSEYNKWFKVVLNEDIDLEFNTCFKVLPPKGLSKKWTIEYNFRANKDKIIISAKDIWNESDKIYNYLSYFFENPKEKLINDLYKASLIYTPFSRSLKMQTPVNIKLELDDVYDFLTNYAQKLQDNDFYVMVPSFWNKETSFKIDLDIKNSNDDYEQNENLKDKSKLNLGQILDYEWNVSVNDVDLNEKELKRLANTKVPFMKINGNWVKLTPEQLTNFKLLWEEHKKEIKINDLLKDKLEGKSHFKGIKLGNIDREDSIEEFLETMSDINKIDLIDEPVGLEAKLRKYQKLGFSWLVYLREKNIGACLADDMGLGKTIQLISLLVYERENSITELPTLIVCPTSLIGNWNKEISKFAPSLKVFIHHGNHRKSSDKFRNIVSDNNVVITSFLVVQKDEKLLNTVKWSGLILDEAQNIKNSGTKQTRAIKRIKSEYKIALTGTPVENKLSELWSIMDFINKGYLGSEKEFDHVFASPIENGKNSDIGNKLKKLISPFVLRRLKTDSEIVRSLPDKNESKEYCTLTKEQAALYKAVVKDMLYKIDKSEGIERKGMVLASLSKLKQICNHPVHYLKDNTNLDKRSGKLNRLLEMLEKIVVNGDKALIFTQFTEMGYFLEKSIKDNLDLDVLFLHGGISRKERDNMVKTFQSDDMKKPIFILSLKAGGVGITLTKANHVFHYDRWWNPAVENQATDRAFRLGQRKDVWVHKFVCNGTLEEKIDKIIEDKKILAENIIGSGDEWLTEMSDDELKKLIDLEENSLLEEEN